MTRRNNRNRCRKIPSFLFPAGSGCFFPLCFCFGNGSGYYGKRRSFRVVGFFVGAAECWTGWNWNRQAAQGPGPRNGATRASEFKKKPQRISRRVAAIEVEGGFDEAAARSGGVQRLESEERDRLHSVLRGPRGWFPWLLQVWLALMPGQARSGTPAASAVPSAQ